MATASSLKKSFLQLDEEEWSKFILSIDEECSKEAKQMWTAHNADIVNNVNLEDVQDRLKSDGVLNDEHYEMLSKRYYSFCVEVVLNMILMTFVTPSLYLTIITATNKII